MFVAQPCGHMEVVRVVGVIDEENCVGRLNDAGTECWWCRAHIERIDTSLLSHRNDVEGLMAYLETQPRDYRLAMAQRVFEVLGGGPA